MNSTIPFEVVENYFHSLHVHSIVLLLICSPGDIKVKLLKALSKKGYLLAFTLASIREHPTYREGAVLDVTCKNSSTIMNNLSDSKAFGMHTEWLLMDITSNNESEFNKRKIMFKHIYALPGSCVVFGRFYLREGEVDFYDVYRVAMWTEMKLNHLTHQKFDNFIPFRLRGTRSNFEDVVLRTAAVVNFRDVFVGIGDNSPPGWETYIQEVFQITRNMAQHLHFSFSLLLLYKYGYEHNGSFDGITGLLQREELDFSCAGIMMRHDRMAVLDYTVAIYTISSPLIFKQPALPSVANIFILPFETEVWIAFGLITGLTIFVLLIEMLTNLKVLKYEKAKEVSTGEIIVAVIGHSSQQGATLELKTVAGKLVLAIFSIFTFFIFIAYSAKIVALLQSSANTIKTLPQLTNSPLAIGIQNVAYNKVYLKESQDTNVKNLYQKKILPQGLNAFVNAEEGIRRVRSGLYAYKVETDWAYKIISETFTESEKCALSEMNVFLLQPLTIAVSKKSGLREHISRSLCWQKEVGLPRPTNPFFSHKPTCNSKGLEYTSISLTDFKPALIAILFGTLMSLITFFVEIFTTIRIFQNMKKINEAETFQRMTRKKHEFLFFKRNEMSSSNRQ